MARERRGPLPVSDPHAEHPSPPGSEAAGAQPGIVAGNQGSPASEEGALGEPPCANAEQRLDDALRRWQQDEILRSLQNLEEEIENLLHELAHDPNRWC